MSYEILDKIKKTIEGSNDNVEWEEIGKIIEVGDGILKISGLTNVQSQEVLEIEIGKEKIKKKIKMKQDWRGRIMVLQQIANLRRSQAVCGFESHPLRQ